MIEVDFGIESAEEALVGYGQPEVFKTDQASRFTSIELTALLNKAKIAISMDRKVLGDTMSSLSGHMRRPNPRPQNRIQSASWHLPISDLLRYSTPTFVA